MIAQLSFGFAEGLPFFLFLIQDFASGNSVSAKVGTVAEKNEQHQKDHRGAENDSDSRTGSGDG